MAGIAATCSSGLILKKTNETITSNGASSLLQFNGLKAVGSNQSASLGFMPNGSISKSGWIINLSVFPDLLI